jgi:hypothetical protein
MESERKLAKGTQNARRKKRSDKAEIDISIPHKIRNVVKYGI